MRKKIISNYKFPIAGVPVILTGIDVIKGNKSKSVIAVICFLRKVFLPPFKVNPINATMNIS